jgi:hypothetical protein
MYCSKCGLEQSGVVAFCFCCGHQMGENIRRSQKGNPEGEHQQKINGF